MRVALIAVVVLCCALAAQAKLVSVSGQGVILTTPPANVYDKGPNDVPSSTLNGALAITSFDEKLHVVLDDPLQISSTVTLQPNFAYDSFFLFFHQKSTEGAIQSATADFTVDNRVIGCTDSIQREFDTTPVFGKAGVLYPTTSGQVSGARGFEAEDGVVGLGTVYTSNNTISQPGDYTRCFTHSCADSNGDACSCSPSLDACLTPQNDQYHCFDNAQALASLPQFSLSSTCVVDKSSAVITVKSCDSSKGCRRDGPKVCLRSSSNGVPSSVDLHVTGGCSCSADITATFNSQATGRGCYPADTTLGCKSGANVLVYGTLTNHGATDPQNKWAAWLQSVVPGSTVTWSAPTSPITASLLSGYDLLITAQLSRVVSAAEAAAVEDYVNNGGALIALAGFINTQTDINQQQSVLAGLGISFVNSLITITSNANNWVYNPANPLINGLQGKWVSYAGGWPSTPIPGGVLFGQESLSTNPWNPALKSVGQTIVLPSGGKIVAWGDEWATFLDQYDAPNNGNSIFWKNAVSWVSNICVSNAPCDANKFTVSSSCTAASHTSSGKGFTLSFSDSASNCN